MCSRSYCLDVGKCRLFVSVITPCYGQAHFLHEPIESLLAEIRPELELTDVDDGSPHNTSDVVRSFVLESNHVLSVTAERHNIIS